MDVYEAIRTRCSVRAYEAKDIEAEKLQRILDAARLAPTARNDQDWKLLVARDPAVRKALAEAAEQPFVGQAPVVLAIVALNPKRMMHCGVPAGPVDCAIVLDHITLAAVTEGLGTCWIGHFLQDAARKALGVPASAEIIELMPLGYPAGGVEAKEKPRKPIEELVSYDKFA